MWLRSYVVVWLRLRNYQTNELPNERVLSEEIPDNLRGVNSTSPGMSAAVNGIENHIGAGAAMSPLFLAHLIVLSNTGRFVVAAVARGPTGSPLRDRGVDHPVDHGRHVPILIAIVGDDRIICAMHAQDRYGPRGRARLRPAIGSGYRSDRGNLVGQIARQPVCHAASIRVPAGIDPIRVEVAAALQLRDQVACELDILIV